MTGSARVRYFRKFEYIENSQLQFCSGTKAAFAANQPCVHFKSLPFFFFLVGWENFEILLLYLAFYFNTLARALTLSYEVTRAHFACQVCTFWMPKLTE